MDFKITKENLISQKMLNKLEDLCVQEEAPRCEAACPLHVQVKELVDFIQKEDFSSAYKTYARRVPFPRLMAQLCDAPCKSQCLREDIGGAIKINELEKITVESSHKKQKAPPFLPKKNKTMAVIGGGIAGMTYALELGKKGFDVILFEKEDKLGGKVNSETKPEIISALDESVSYLLTFKNIKINYNSPVIVDNISDLEAFRNEIGADALFVSFPCFLTEKIESATGWCKDTGVFSVPQKDSTYIFKASYGKTTAVSSERYATKVSMTVGREKEGVYETKLYTNTAGIAEVKAPETILTKEDAILEAHRCIKCECLECVKGCAFLQSEDSYPKKLIREAYNNISIVMGIRHSNKMIAGCQLCGQCGEVCPTGLSMKDVISVMRDLMVDQEKMPPSYYDFAMKDMSYSNGEELFLARNQPGFDKSKYVYFPSCQLSASEPELVMRSYVDLTKKLEGGVGLMLACCGIMALWAGETHLFESGVEKLRKELEGMGNPTIITSCPTCKTTLESSLNANVIGIWDILDPADKKAKNITLTIHDACGARTDSGTQNRVRQIIEDSGYDIKEAFYCKDESACCGYGGLTAFARPDVADMASKQLYADDQSPSATYCINCRDRILRHGGQSYHVLELIYPEIKVNREYPLWSNRHNNRKITKYKLLNDFWKEEIMPKELLNLKIDADLLDVMEERMILKSDLSTAISESEKNGDVLLDKSTGHYIVSRQIGNVTYWAEYQKDGDIYTIINAYSHRMSIII